jgi:hypothetical protein
LGTALLAMAVPGWLGVVVLLGCVGVGVLLENASRASARVRVKAR